MPKYKKQKVRVDQHDAKKIVLGEGYSNIKTVRTDNGKSGLIRVPKRFIGKKFKVILIPLDDVIKITNI